MIHFVFLFNTLPNKWRMPQIAERLVQSYNQPICNYSIGCEFRPQSVENLGSKFPSQLLIMLTIALARCQMWTNWKVEDWNCYHQVNDMSPFNRHGNIFQSSSRLQLEMQMVVWSKMQTSCGSWCKQFTRSSPESSSFMKQDVAKNQICQLDPYG